jgi:hypothetical protein
VKAGEAVGILTRTPFRQPLAVERRQRSLGDSDDCCGLSTAAISIAPHTVNRRRRRVTDPAGPNSARLGFALPVIERAAGGPKHADAPEADCACRICDTSADLA